jgi:S-DNA-T family DNA segregation ATPase FtsK/SpoIIIE
MAKRFWGFLAKPLVWRLILILVTVGLLYLFYSLLVDWGIAVLTLFGFGLVLIAIAIGVAVWIIAGRHFSTAVRRWNWFVGGIVFAVAIWGILSFFSPDAGILSRATLGGKIGQSIAGTQGVVSGLRIAGLIFLGVIFIIPRKVWHAVTAIGEHSHRAIENIRARPEPQPQATAEVETPVETAPAEPSHVEIAEVEQIVGEHKPVITPGGWQLPPIDILDRPTEVELDQEGVNRRARLIEEALASYGVEAKVVQTNIGPTVTQFGVEPGWDRKYKEIKERGRDGTMRTRLEEVSRTRVRVERITSLTNDLALALAVPSIRIEAPVPGKSMVGVEVPNIVFGAVSLRSVIETAAFQKIKAKSMVAFVLGKGAGGEAVVADLAKMPHLLIAGATGSGKTVCLESIICCLLLHNSPDDVQFIMIDPKRVELVVFNGIPNLVAPVVVDTDRALKALRWLNHEMDRRYRQFARMGVRNIEGYNKDRSLEERLPYLVLVIDELADLMMTAFDEVEHSLCRLAQLARATGIHLVVATQRPSVDVITGLIKANFPTRISFAVTSQVDSRTILDAVGAEKLLGRGDMLYMPTEAAKSKRLQGVFVSDSEMQRLVYFWGNQYRPGVSSINFDEISELTSSGQRFIASEDPLFEEVRNMAKEHEHLSISFLQRRLRIGYPRAARLMDALQQEGLVKTPPPKEES